MSACMCVYACMCVSVYGCMSVCMHVSSPLRKRTISRGLTAHLDLSAAAQYAMKMESAACSIPVCELDADPSSTRLMATNKSAKKSEYATALTANQPTSQTDKLTKSAANTQTHKGQPNEQTEHTHWYTVKQTNDLTGKQPSNQAANPTNNIYKKHINRQPHTQAQEIGRLSRHNRRYKDTHEQRTHN